MDEDKDWEDWEEVELPQALSFDQLKEEMIKLENALPLYAKAYRIAYGFLVSEGFSREQALSIVCARGCTLG